MRLCPYKSALLLLMMLPIFGALSQPIEYRAQPGESVVHNFGVPESLVPPYGADFKTAILPAGMAIAAPQNQRWFEDVTHKAGIHHRHHTRRFNNPYAEIMQGYTKLGAAVAVADYD